MKKIKTITALLMVSFAVQAQNKDNDTVNHVQFNRWSVEANAGLNKAIKPFSDGYYSSDPDKALSFSNNHYDVGVRYMLSETFGLKLGGGYNLVENQTGSGSKPFSTKSYSISLEGVVNMGHIMNFEVFTKRIGLLAHGGIQVSRFIASDIRERNGGVMVGITPQFKLTRWCALTGDFTYIGNIRQHLTWDGQVSSKDNNLTGSIIYTSLGFNFYLGKKQNHADWYFEKANQIAAVETIAKDNKKRLEELENMMNDTDRDGVPDYLDAENNTPAGVRVDTKGRFIDTNKNQIPDELEPKDGRDGQSAVASTKSDALHELIAEGYLNIFFDVNKDEPNNASSNSMYHIIKYLKKFPDTHVTLKGYADKKGDEKMNRNLSQRRAQRMSDLLVASGISKERISILGEGVDTSFPDSDSGLQLARRVSVTLE